MYEINIVHADGRKDCLGHMEERHVTYNRYNEGLLIGAGKLHNSDMQREVFLAHGAKYNNEAEIEFRNEEKVFRGIFRFINFIQETHTVVIASVSAVHECCPLEGQSIVVDSLAPSKPVAALRAARIH